MMHYVTVSEGRASPGLRLVLTAGVAAPWSEAAKAIFRIKGLRYVAIAQTPGGENHELLKWTGQAAAPTAVDENDKAYTDSLDILFLAERLALEPCLVPNDSAARILILGLSREIVGRLGLGWNRRLMLQAADLRAGPTSETQQRLMKRHNFQPVDAELAEGRIAGVLSWMADLLKANKRGGGRYFVGEHLSCADIYWAVFSMMFRPLAQEHCPMSDQKRARFENIGPRLSAALDPALIAHRDFVLSHHVGLPMDFLATA